MYTLSVLHDLWHKGVVERLIQHKAKQSVVSASRPQPECHKLRNSRTKNETLSVLL